MIYSGAALAQVEAARATDPLLRPWVPSAETIARSAAKLAADLGRIEGTVPPRPTYTAEEQAAQRAAVRRAMEEHERE